jgi:hypothetical protein
VQVGPLSHAVFQACGALNLCPLGLYLCFSALAAVAMSSVTKRNIFPGSARRLPERARWSTFVTPYLRRAVHLTGVLWDLSYAGHVLAEGAMSSFTKRNITPWSAHGLSDLATRSRLVTAYLRHEMDLTSVPWNYSYAGRALPECAISRVAKDNLFHGLSPWPIRVVQSAVIRHPVP